MRKVLFLAIDFPENKEDLKIALQELIDNDFYCHDNACGVTENKINFDYDCDNVNDKEATSLCTVMNWDKIL